MHDDRDDPLALPSARALVAGLAIAADSIIASDDAAIVPETITIELPIEVELSEEGSELALRASPPTQYTQTSVMPVFHALRVRVVRTE